MYRFLNTFTTFRDIGIKDKLNITNKLQEEINAHGDLIQEIKDSHGLDLEDFIFLLGDRESFKQKYLTPHYKMYNLLKEINDKINELRNKKLSEQELKDNLEYFEKKKSELAESKIEVYLCNAVSGDRKALKFFAGVAMPFGLLHVGLLIDDICVQWGRGLLGESLIEIRNNVKYKDYIFAMELKNEIIWSLIKETYNNLEDYITGKKPYENMGTLKAYEIANTQLDQIAETCIEFNKTKKYNLVIENCQHFVMKILNKIKLKIYKEGEVGKVFKKANEIGDPFDFSFAGKVFSTRKDLDNFALETDFEKLPYDHKMVLFYYRNVFDYYARVYPVDDKYKTEDKAKKYWNELLKKEKFGS